MAVTRREQGTTVADRVQTTQAQSGGTLVVQAVKGSVAASQTDAEIFQFTAPQALELESVQVYCTATAAVASVDVRENGVSVLQAVATPSAGNVVTPAITNKAIASGATVTVHVTTNLTGSIADLHVTLVFKAALV